MSASHFIPSETSAPKAALLLGWGGVIPFVALALASLTAAPDAAPLLLGYGAIILGFMGAVWWGVAMAQGETAPRLYAISVLPALASFAALLTPVWIGLWLLAAGFAALLLFDLAQVGKGAAPSWYGALRVKLTSCVLLSLVLVAVLQGRVVS
ncbi:DUF3429 domain-containing protein [uncultured Rhodoblastus sp.]|uniref:DUF3429 domain-containing protein n=1 Tax=uncultured Rhodoblastus sp. TaxID=543037 RepID=UPI0025D5C014|nr:DUF3429 domain-containing protein [uncultured Rhodoblastus sp.]